MDRLYGVYGITVEIPKLIRSFYDRKYLLLLNREIMN